jgi:uncharacterized protein (DUF305 family)
MTTETFATRLAAATAGIALTAAVAACGTTNTAPSPANAAPASSAAPTVSQAHNQADINFAQQMIPHHAQAVAMAKLVTQRASSPGVKDLANRIEAAQQPEIDQMTGWLRAWGAPAPDTTDPDMGDMGGTSQQNMPGMNHSTMAHSGNGGAMPGMMSSDQMHQLSQASGPAFDKMFLQMMISHHQGAITMAKTELAKGQNPDAKALAQRIIDAQQAEIAQMRSMLAS